VTMKNTKYALSAYYVLASAEASSCLSRYDGVEYGLNVRAPADSTSTANIYAHSRTKGFGSEVRKRILLGTYALSADAFDNYFLQAQRIRQLVKEDFDKVFRVPDYRNSRFLSSSNNALENKDAGVDILLHPSAIQTAPLLENPVQAGGNGIQTYLQDILTVPASLAGLPGLGVPMCTNRDGDGLNEIQRETLPVGFSIIGQWGCEKMLFAVGRAVEGLQRR